MAEIHQPSLHGLRQHRKRTPVSILCEEQRGKNQAGAHGQGEAKEHEEGGGDVLWWLESCSNGGGCDELW